MGSGEPGSPILTTAAMTKAEFVADPVGFLGPAGPRDCFRGGHMT